MRRAMPPLSSFARGLVSLLIAGVLLGSLPTGFASARPIVQDAASLVAPALSKPADATTTDDTTPTFKWSAVKGAEAYRFELALDPSFTALVNTIEDRRRTYTLRTNLEPGLTYFWRAGSVDQLGGISWSETRTLTIAGAAQEPPAATATVPTSTPSPAATATPTSLPRVRATSTPDPIVIAAAVPVSQVSGTMQPSTGIRISGAGRSRGSTTSTSVVDRNLGTLWFSAGGTPTEAFVYIKLDRTRKVGTIRWMMGYSGYADRYEIQISKDRKTWTTIGKRTNSAAGTWREITVNRDARYVRFYFTNPKRDPMLGGLAEVEVMAATTAAVAKSTATSSATPVPPATSTPVPTATDTPVPTATKTATPAKTPTATKTSTPTKTAPPASSATPTPSATATATIAGNLLSNTIMTTTPTPSATATVTPTTMPTPTASPTATATPTIVPTLTATPSPTATSTPSPTATPVPTATATPAPTVLPISGGLIVNPSFEQGEAGWHLEGQSGVTDQGAIGGSRALRIESGGGLADQHLTLLPGNTYELSVWGRTDGGVDLGEVGVIYRDASWRRLQGLEPADITFTSTTYQKKTLVFTVPQSVAHVTVYVWKEAGPAGLLVDDLYLVKALSALPSPTVTTPTLSCQQLIAPAYFYPTTGYWQTMIADSSALGIIVLNPNSGVGAKHEWRYDAPLAQARAAGIRIIGYIQTDYGSRAVSEILTEMDRYREWYGVTSYFLDEGDTDIASIGLYTEMTAYAHAMGGITVINFGYHPHPAYMDITDHAIVFEDAMNVFLAYSPPSWIKDYPADRFMNLIYGVPEDQVDEIIQITRERNLGTVWITDDHINTGSPYNTLPTYWSSLNQTLAAGCSGS